MDLELTDEQTWLAESVEQLLAQSPGAETWSALVEFGALAIASGEDGLGAVELALVGRALGQSLATVPFIETAAARYATRALASPEHPAFAALHGGEDAVALCLLEPGAGWELAAGATIAKSPRGAAAVIEGHKVAVHHANDRPRTARALQRRRGPPAGADRPRWRRRQPHPDRMRSTSRCQPPRSCSRESRSPPRTAWRPSRARPCSAACWPSARCSRPAKQSEPPRRWSSWRATTPGSGASSVGRSRASRPSATCSRTCTSSRRAPGRRCLFAAAALEDGIDGADAHGLGRQGVYVAGNARGGPRRPAGVRRHRVHGGAPRAPVPPTHSRPRRPVRRCAAPRADDRP